MKSNQHRRKLALPAVLIIGLLVFLLAGGSYITNYLQQQIFVERTAQLNEITSQVRVNLCNALDFHWNYLTAAVNLLKRQQFDTAEDVTAYIRELEQVMETEDSSSRLVLLDSQGNCCDGEGKHGVWSDIDLISSGEERYTFISDSYIYDRGSYWAFVQKLETPIQTEGGAEVYTHAVLLKDVYTLTEYYDSAACTKLDALFLKNGGGRRGSNPRPSEPQSDALTD